MLLRSSLLALSVLLLIASNVHGKTGFLSLERNDGKTVEAEVLLFEDDEVRIRNRSGQVFTTPDRQLSEKPLTLLKTHREPMMRASQFSGSGATPIADPTSKIPPPFSGS